jgi:dihydroxyacetone kinase
MVNGLGATPPMELSIVADAAVRDLRRREVVVERVWAGNFLTALDMAGCSLSVLPVDDEILAALDTPTTAPAWPQAIYIDGRAALGGAVVLAPSAGPLPAGALAGDDPVRRAIESVAEVLIAGRDRLTELDREVGDGDMGISLARGAAALLAECPQYPGEQGPAAVLRAMSATVRRSVGGTSGPLYAIMLLRAASALSESTASETTQAEATQAEATQAEATQAAVTAGTANTARAWAAALQAAVDGVREVGGAEVGDRTMVDALAPAAAAFAGRLDDGESWPDALRAAVDAAQAGADATTAITARLGRSSYLGDRVLGHPDPGAEAIAVWLGAIADTLTPRP